MKVSPKQIFPSQDFLKPQTIGFIFECIKHGELEKLPPSPIVREDDKGHLAIDGHSLIAVRLHRNEDVDIHLAKSAEDGLPETSKANIQRNHDLKAKYDSVLTERLRIQEEGINNSKDLLSRYPDLF